MRTLARGLLVAILLVLVLFVVRSPAAQALAGQIGRSPLERGAVLLAFALLLGMISDVLVFALLPGVLWGGRFLHTLTIGVLFLLMYLVMLAMVGVWPGWQMPLVLSQQWPLLVPFVLGLITFLFITALIGPMPQHIDLPRPMHGYLHADEQLLWRAQQTRLKHPITPHSLIATDQRLIKYKPTRLGLTASIEDYNYVDIANVRIEEGLFFSTVAMKERFQGDDMAFPNIPKRAGEGFVRIVTDQTQRRQGRVPLAGQRPGQPRSAAAPETAAGPAEGPAPDESALAILQRRLASGEITREQYEQLRKVLGQS
jgi:Short C-terminal domain/Bacterial PH domain